MIYLDTSVAVPMFVPEAASRKIEAWYERYSEIIVASDWILTEFASALSIKERKGELHSKHARLAWKEFENFCQAGIRLLPVSRQVFADAARLIREATSALRAGDSLHLAMASGAGARSIATTDTVLAKAAKMNGLSVELF